MKRMFSSVICLAVVQLCYLPLVGAVVVEPAKSLPLIQDVDVVVVGGTCGAVAAAESAARCGAKVFLVTASPSLGEDVAGTLRLWAAPDEAVSSELMRAMFGVTKPEDGKLSYTTPLQVKKALDTVLLQANVTFLTGAHATDVLNDAQGNFAGIVIVDRSGRQAIRAKTLIDATERANLARIAGATLTPFPAGTYTFSRVIISGEAPAKSGRVVPRTDWQPLKDSVQLSSKTTLKPAMYECFMELPLADGSARVLAGAEQAARDRTFTTTQLDAAERLFFIAPDHIVAVKPGTADWTGAAAFELDALRPAKTPHVYVLSALADTSRTVAAMLVKPANAIQIGQRLGKLVADASKARPPLSAVHLRVALGGQSKAADVREFQGTLTKPYTAATGSVPCNARDLPVLAEVECLVVGGGTTGAPAGIGAVQIGLKTLVLEQLYELGGVQTAGMICGYYFGNQRGFTKEVDEGVAQTGRVKSQAKAEWYRNTIRRGGGEIWFGSMAIGAVMEGNKLVGVVVVMPNGQRGVIRTKAVIDATGNADVAAAVGEPTEFYLPEELINQGVGMAVIRLGAGGHNNDFAFVDDSDASDLCFFGLRTRSMTEGGWDVSQLVNSRERRRLVGVYQVTVFDYLIGRTYPDTVTQHKSRFDLHGDASSDFFQTKNIRVRNHGTMNANLPYRALLPKKTDGLLVVGLGMSATRDAMSILRMQADLQNQGYVAAYAVSLALRGRCELRNIPIPTLQKHLVEKGVLPEAILTERDSHPIPDVRLQMAAHNVMIGYDDLAYLFADPVRATPHLLEKWNELSRFSDGRDPENSLLYAHLLALFGNPSGEAELIEWVNTHTWDDKWPVGKDPGTSRMGAYILALGRTRSKQAVPAILARGQELCATGKTPANSQCRILGLACEAIGDPAFADLLAQLLDLPGVAGHSMVMAPTIQAVPGYDSRSNYSHKEKQQTAREINLARALFRIGDKSGKAAAILRSYADDPRGFYANYARMVLAETRPISKH
jgi:ribulose 1,5-bisphosphate synthetase/thiazole synthase